MGRVIKLRRSRWHRIMARVRLFLNRQRASARIYLENVKNLEK
jgi:hypothetical protein